MGLRRIRATFRSISKRDSKASIGIVREWCRSLSAASTMSGLCLTPPFVLPILGALFGCILTYFGFGNEYARA